MDTAHSTRQIVAGCGRLLSMSKVGLPEPGGLWLAYLASELVLPWVLAAAHYARPRSQGMARPSAQTIRMDEEKR